MHLHFEKYLIALTLSVTAFPVWAAHNYSEDFNPTEAISIGTTSLKPGQYELRAGEESSDLQVLQHNKVIATVPVHWKALPTKTKDAQVVTDSGKVTEVQFSGSAQAADISQ